MRNHKETFLFIDSECVMCDGFAKWLIPRLREDSGVQISPIGGETFKKICIVQAEPQRDAIIFATSADFESGFAAVRSLSEEMVPSWKWLFRSLAIIPGWLGEPLYDLVARNRKRIFGLQSSCSLAVTSSKRFIA